MTSDLHAPLDLLAFEGLYRATVGRVHTLARRLCGREHADEATQEVFLRAWRKRGSFRGEAAPAAWLSRLARNELVNQARARARRDEAELGEEPPARLAGQRANRGSDLKIDLERALADLPDGARWVFVLHDVEGQAHAEISERLGISVGTSKSQLHRARALLRAALYPWSEADDE